MTNKVFLTALLAFLLVTGFLWALSALAPAPNSRARVIGFGEPVVMLTANGEKPIASRIDTGADSTSIDTDLALSLGLIPDMSRRKTIRTQMGVEQRAVVDLRFRLAGKEISSEATVTDRSKLPTPMIIGRSDLAGFLVDPARVSLGGTGKRPAPGVPVAGFQERIWLHSPAGDVQISARLDSGSQFSSIDVRFARAIGLEPNEGQKRTIETAGGAMELPTVSANLSLGTTEIVSSSTVADRSALTNRMLLGREDLDGYLIDPNSEFLVSGESSASPLSAVPFLRLQSPGLSSIIIIIPILGSVVVLLKLIAGVRTFGIFGPVVIALSMLSLEILPGLGVYVLLLTAGISVKLLVLDRLKLSHIAEFSLVMFVLVLALVAATTIPFGPVLSFAGIFFPLIITSHLIEQASRSIEEHSLADFVPVMGSTLAAAALLAYYASFLVKLPTTLLWAIFIASVVAVILAGFYSGLRLTELLRFKFLKKTHIHE